MAGKFISFIEKRKYELLLIALLQHLFIGIFLSNFKIYTEVIWPINMLILGVASVGVFREKDRRVKLIKNILLTLIILFPLLMPLLGHIANYYQFLNLVYVAFFAFIFIQVLKFLIRPSYINLDIILASICGYLLLIEVAVFFLQFLYTENPNSFNGINQTNLATVFMDLVYFCSITLTSIGYGDITPNVYYTKLLTSLIGIFGQFYSVVLVGIIISKFTSRGK